MIYIIGIVYLVIGTVVGIDNWTRSLDLRLSNIGTIFVGALIWPIVLVDTLGKIVNARYKDKILIKRRK